METKVNCGWSPVHIGLPDAGLVAICRIQWGILKALVFSVFSANFNVIHIVMQAWRLKSARCMSSTIPLTNEAQSLTLVSDPFDFVAQ
jgi:hypothetical protein